MAYDNDDLEYNECFTNLQKKFPKLYEKAQENCFMICIPHNRYSDSTKPSLSFYEKHILQPSPYFKNEYESLHKPPIKIRVLEGVLQVTHPSLGTYTVKILHEESYYNKAYQAFRILCIDGTFEKPSTLLSTQSFSGESFKDKFFDTRSTLKEFETLMASYPPAQKLLDTLAKQFNDGYVVVRGYLDALSDKLEGMRDEIALEWVKSPEIAQVRTDPRLPNVLNEAVECCLLTKVALVYLF
jgi:hypothetical protein